MENKRNHFIKENYMFNIKEQVKILPEKPGVYLMKNENGEIIYVGKSKNLKNRVSSYFRGYNSHAIKVRKMVDNVSEFEYFITDNEVEALILEANLIKKHQPRFNILLRDDKQYPYIKVTMNEKFPRVIKVRKVVSDKSKYFGPYVNVESVNKTLEIINKIYPIRKCNKNLNKKNERPCLNFHISNCLGPCKGDVHRDEYMKNIEEILSILNGKDDYLIELLENKMKNHVEKLEFEKAGECRDHIIALENLKEKQKIVSSSRNDQDYISLASYMDRICIMIFFVRKGKLIGREQYIFEDVIGTGDSEILSDFIGQFYSGASYIPKEVIVGHMPENKEALEEWLTQIGKRNVKLLLPQKGEKKKLILMLEKNAEEYLEKFYEKVYKENILINKNLTNLRDILELEEIPNRIEAYDISNILGVYSVGTMVVYEKGRKKNSDYRRFKIKTIEGPNDYGSMQEVLYRRMNRQINGDEESKMKFGAMPDLILIDGGKGQVNKVVEVMEALRVNVPVAGLVKDDKHRTDRLYYKGQMITIKNNMDLYRFLGGIQEEVHRYAIAYHKSLRDKGLIKSPLDEIKGVGPAKKRALLKEFKNINAIKNASIEQLTEVKGITKELAENIINTLNIK
jgi:excinuclease ABC subunit C